MLETEEHRQAYVVWKELGNKRSARKVAKKLGNTTHASVNSWRREFNWDERLRKEEEAERANLPAVIQPKGELDEKVSELINLVNKSLSNYFTEEDDGKIIPKFEIATATDFKSMVVSLKSLIQLRDELRHRKEREAPKKFADTINFNFNELPQDKQFELMMGKSIDVESLKDPGRAVKERAEEADYTEVSEDTGEDGYGCDVADLSDGQSGSGDEG